MRRTSSSYSCPPRLRRHQRHQLVVGQPHFLPGVEVEVVGRRPRPRSRAGRRPGPAGCRRRSGAGRRRCAGAAGRCRRTPRASSRSCTGRGRARCGPARPARRRRSPAAAASIVSCSRRLTIIMRRVHLVGFGILHPEVPPEAAAHERPQRRGQRGSCSISRAHPLVLDELLGRQRPFGHLAVAAIGQVDLADRRHVVDRLGQRGHLDPVAGSATRASKNRASQPSS